MSETTPIHPEITKFIVYKLAKETTKLLRESQEELKNIKWTEGEANLDTGYSTLACSRCNKAWENIKNKYFEYENISISCSIPDINIQFIYPNGKIIKEKIELKQSKGTSLPGSTYGNLDINQSVIWCRYPTNKNKLKKCDFVCRQYHNLYNINNKNLFQDRTPRPSLRKFNKLLKEESPEFETKEKIDMKEHFAQCALNRISSKKGRHSWQDNLTICLQEKIINNFIQNTSVEEFIALKNTIN